MFDLHSHILPGLDDGAKTIEESMKMLRVAAADGTTGIAATHMEKTCGDGFLGRVGTLTLNDVAAAVSGSGTRIKAYVDGNHLTAEVSLSCESRVSFPVE